MVNTCPSSKGVSKVNTRFGFDFVSEHLDRVLCVEADNNPLYARIYTNRADVTESELVDIYEDRYAHTLSALSSDNNAKTVTLAPSKINSNSYNYGGKIVGGTVEGDVVKYVTDSGLQLPFSIRGVDANGACIPSNEPSPVHAVPFGTDSSYSCWLRVSLAEFENYCRSGITNSFHLVQNSPFTAFARKATETNFNNLGGFVQRMHTNAAQPQGHFSGTVCSSLVTDLTYQFAYALDGNVDSPSFVVTGVRSFHQRATKLPFIASPPPVGAPEEVDGVSRTTLVLTSRVQFERAKDQNITEKKKKAPSISVTFPRDLFYPFVAAEEDAAPVAAGAWGGIAAAMAVAATSLVRM